SQYRRLETFRTVLLRVLASRTSPQPTCQTSGTMTTVKVRAAVAGFECAVTDSSQELAPANAASWFHRWFAVQIPSGKKARKEPRRARRKFRATVRSAGATERSGWSVVRGSAISRPP